MIKQLAFVLIFISLLQVICFAEANASVERKDLIPLGENLGLPVYEWKDDSLPTKALIVAFHGMTFYGLAFDDAATHLASQGYPVYSFDFRGFGSWREANSKYHGDGKAHFSQSVEDAKKLINALHSEYPNYKIFCIGESLGSNLIMWALTQETLPIDGAILCGLGVKATLHPHPKWLSDFVLGLSNPDRPLNLEPYIKTNLASNKEVTQIYLHDPKIHYQLSSKELVKAMITNHKSIEQIELLPDDVPLLIISGDKDRIFNKKALTNLAEVLGPEQATLKLLPGRGHLLLELHPLDSDLASTIDTWLDNKTQIKETHIPADKQFKEQSQLQLNDALRML